MFKQTAPVFEDHPQAVATTVPEAAIRRFEIAGRGPSEDARWRS